jgi:hypothetical protein
MYDELVVPYRNADRGKGWAIGASVLALLAALALWLLFLCVNQLRIMAGIAPSDFDNLQLVADPSTPWQVIGCGIVLLVVVAGLGRMLAFVAALWWRCAHEDWWLRLSGAGFEINDRLRRPRRYRWADIDRFLLVYPSGEPDSAEVPPGQTFAEVLRDGAAGPPVRLGFRYLSDRRRHPGREVDVYLMGWWDRPFDQAVNLMNDWLARHRTTEPE